MLFTYNSWSNFYRKKSRYSHHLIISDLLQDHYIRNLFIKMKDKVVKHLSSKANDLNLNVRFSNLDSFLIKMSIISYSYFYIFW